MDELDGDEFADFQTYNHNDVIDDDKQLANNKSETIFKQSNIYELDVFAFQEFVTNFEEQLIDMFQVDQTYQTVKSQQRFFNNSINVDQFNDEIDDEQQPMSPIHSQEDMINDCPYDNIFIRFFFKLKHLIYISEYGIILREAIIVVHHYNLERVKHFNVISIH